MELFLIFVLTEVVQVASWKIFGFGQAQIMTELANKAYPARHGLISLYARRARQRLMLQLTLSQRTPL